MQPNTEAPDRPTRCQPMVPDEQLAAVRERLPGWDVWYVSNYQFASRAWCGRPDGALVSIKKVESDSDTEFLKRVVEFEAELPKHIANARTELASLPPNRPESADRRKVLDAQLQALLALQARLVAS